MIEAPDGTLVVYSDYVCPFCYLGKASLEAYKEQADGGPPVQWRPFDLRWHKRDDANEIDRSVPDGKDEAYYDRAKANVDRLKEAYGVEMTWDIPKDVDAWDAHKVALHIEEAHDEATLAAWHEAVFEALWRDGRDIGAPEVLRELATGVGLTEAEVDQATASDRLEGRLEEAFSQAHRAGVTGVPTFAYGQLAVPGAVPPEHIAKLVENG